MGNPLSPLLSEIFMDNLEHTISLHPLFRQCIFWFRYVDDILVCFNGTDRQLTSFHNYINSIHSQIKFTIEKEVNKSINFLDLSISHNNSTFEFGIYHKPTHTDITIHSSSFHPFNHKIAAYQSMIHRLINVPMNKVNFDSELNRIYTIAFNNGFSKDIIDNLLERKQKSQTLSLIYPIVKNNNTNKYNIITYIGRPSVKIANLIKTDTNTIAYKTNNNINRFLKNNKDKTDNRFNSGVYMLTCNCSKVYVGQTGRSFDTRIKEHEKSFLLQKTDSTFASHCIDEKHNFNNNYKILHKQDKGKKLNLLEGLEINRYNRKGLLLNDQIDLNKSPLLNLNLL